MRVLITVTPFSNIAGRKYFEFFKGLTSLLHVRSPYVPPLHWQAFEVLVWIYRDVTFASESNNGHIKETLNTHSCDFH